MRRLARGGSIIGCALAIAASASCTATTAGHARTSQVPRRYGTVTGTLHMSGGPAPGFDTVVRGEVYAFARASLSGTPIATTRTTQHGAYRLRLPAGTYFLGARSPNFNIDPRPATPPCRARQPAVVSRGSASTLDVYCPMK